jgi:hypothetical protein
MADAINALDKGLRHLHEPFLDAQAASDAWHRSLLDLADSAGANGRSLSEFTAAGLANRDAVRAAAEAAIRERDANVANGMAIDKANNLYREHIRALQAAAIARYGDRDAVWALIGALEKVPRYVTTEFIQQFTVRGVPLGEHSGLRIDELAPRQHGGPVLAGHAYLVGERGPEPFVPATNGTIFPAGQSYAAAAGGPIEITLRIPPSGNAALDALVGQIQAEVTHRGGSGATLGIKQV